MHFDCILNEFWLKFDSILTEFWQHFDWILTAFWLHFGWIFTAFWLNFDCILIVFWLHYDCILAAQHNLWNEKRTICLLCILAVNHKWEETTSIISNWVFLTINFPICQSIWITHSENQNWGYLDTITPPFFKLTETYFRCSKVAKTEPISSPLISKRLKEAIQKVPSYFHSDKSSKN